MLTRIKASAAAILARRSEYQAKAKPFVDKSLAYAKENPSDVMLGIMTLLLMDIESDVDDLEAHTGVSAAVDLHDYRTR
tara:strand:- start:456 stop:692 length:237 start_codon:yes stop_codon:yes gene_type:complete